MSRRPESVFDTLIDAPALAAHLDDPSWVVVDCRFDLAAPDAGERAYREAHVPGAAYAHLDRDLSGAVTGHNGRHPLPDVGDMAATFGRLGIDAATQVVAYDQDSGMIASRLWWMLRYLGHDAVAVLDGGFARWCREGRPTRPGVEARPPRRFEPHVRPGMLVALEEMTSLVSQPTWRLLDARAPGRYRGEVEPLDPQAGHIPGAVNRFYMDNLDAESRFLAADRLRAAFAPLLSPVAPDHVVAYCGSGVSACHNLLAMEVAGLRGARLYAGSWSEWCADPARNIEKS